MKLTKEQSEALIEKLSKGQIVDPLAFARNKKVIKVKLEESVPADAKLIKLQGYIRSVDDLTEDFYVFYEVACD